MCIPERGFGSAGIAGRRSKEVSMARASTALGVEAGTVAARANERIAPAEEGADSMSLGGRISLLSLALATAIPLGSQVDTQTGASRTTNAIIVEAPHVKLSCGDS